MPYEPLPWQSIEHDRVRVVFERANGYLADVYASFFLPSEPGEGGSGLHSSTLVLLCVVDGLSQDIYPIKPPNNHERRFVRLIVDRLAPYWGQPPQWVEINFASTILYKEFRNPLVHQLGIDPKKPMRPPEYREPVVGRWGPIPEQSRQIGMIESLTNWSLEWSVLAVDTRDPAAPRMKLTLAGLYWMTKRLTLDLMASPSILSDAAQHLDRLQNFVP